MTKRDRNIYEYDGYRLPELLKEETPETKAKKEDALKRLDELIRNRHKYVIEDEET